MNRVIRLALALICSSLAGALSWAAPISRGEVPEPLRPWIDWVLKGHEEARCPFFQGSEDRRQCAWPSALALDLGESGGRFTQRWLVHREEWVALPGDDRFWPQELRVDGRPAAVVVRDGAPAVRLPEGRHEVSGRWAWSALPPLLQVPTGTGLLRLTVRGQTLEFPLLDEQGRLWLRSRTEEEREETRLEVVVHRKVLDEIPLVLETRIEVQAAGRSREVALGRALPDGLVSMSLAAPLPARVDPDGRLRIQVRPGRWTILLIARHEGPASSFTLPAGVAPWPGDEVWVFDARPHLRLVEVEGVPGVDPQQTTLPDEWKTLPAYLIRAGETMTLAERRRGDSDPAPDRLSLERTWWLDFDGGGFTVQDRIAGRLERSWRLEMLPPAALGRASVNGQAQFVTVGDVTGYAGVELRQAEVRLDAESRIEGAVSDTPAVGWDNDFHQVSGRIHLPPGWRLFHASGVDHVSRTWLGSWTLLDLFLVLIIAMAIARLWGPRAGALVIVTLALIWIEPGAPTWAWLAVLACEALRRGLPEGRALRLVAAAHLVALAILMILMVPFMVRQVRAAIYPALEEPIASALAAAGSGGLGRVSGFVDGGIDEDAAAPRAFPAPVSPPTEDEVMLEAAGEDSAKESSVAPEMVARKARMAAGEVSEYLTRADVYVPDPAAVVQTGPGLPEWAWRQVNLTWRGPVERGQRLRLTLLPPSVNFLLAFLRVILLALVTIRILPLPPGSRAASLLGRLGLARALPAVIAILGVSILAVSPARAEIPSQDLLNELRDRLLEKPECLPECASIPRMALEAGPSSLTLRLEIHAAAPTAVPLPGGADQWMPRQVLLDGSPAPGLARTEEGHLWISLSPGSHQVLMEGSLPGRDAVPIPLPLRPHSVTARARGWRVEGLLEDGRAADNLQLLRIRGAGAGAVDDLEPGPLPPFVLVERQLNLGLQWHVETRITRMTPPGAAILLDVPLLEGESVTTEGISVKNGRASISIGPSVEGVGWTSTLKPRPVIDLSAPEGVAWTENWRLAAGQIWHVEVDGIPEVHAPGRQDPRQREWRPWPGEKVFLRLTRPAGLPGRTLTIQRSDLTLGPGLRATDATLSLVLQSSRGGQHVVTLPETAELQSVSIDDAVQPIRQEHRSVTLPFGPGTQTASLTWRQKPGVGLVFGAPDVGLGAPSVNATTRIVMPLDRWVLFLGGPRLGPAVLFWSFLFVALLASIGLGQVRQVPLRWHHWLLLALGLTQVSIWGALPIVAWILALGWRAEKGAAPGNLRFNLQQAALALLTVAALLGLFGAIRKGLLGLPEMQIAGNGSSRDSLQWYQDRAGEALPRPWVFSLPLMVYRLAMLAWALWLAQALLRWLRWGWSCFTAGGYWRPIRKKKVIPA